MFTSDISGVNCYSQHQPVYMSVEVIVFVTSQGDKKTWLIMGIQIHVSNNCQIHLYLNVIHNNNTSELGSVSS